MKNKVLILICICLSHFAYGQTMFKMPANLNTGADLVEQALENIFISVHQSYALEDENGQRFGRGGGPCFNSIEHIGIETTKGVIFFENVTKPWDYDDDFSKYRAKYKPYIIETKIGRTNSHKVDSLCVADSMFVSKGKYFILQDRHHENGLEASSVDSLSKDGWFIWVTTSKKNEKKVAINAYKREVPEINKDGVIEIVQPNLTDKIIGAFYVAPFVSKPGVLQFKIEAIMSRLDSAQKWELIPIIIDNARTSINDNGDNNENLTPIKNEEEI